MEQPDQARQIAIVLVCAKYITQNIECAQQGSFAQEQLHCIHPDVDGIEAEVEMY